MVIEIGKNLADLLSLLAAFGIMGAVMIAAFRSL